MVVWRLQRAGSMTMAAEPPGAPETPLFSDGVGERVIAVDDASGELLQILRVRPELAALPAFELALRERTARLANFRHTYYARIRRVDRAPQPEAGLAIVSDHVEGTRLSDILRSAEDRGLPLDINTALCLVRQLVPAVALLHENARDVAHGLIAPERLVITPHARLVIVEHVLGSAIEQLRLTRERLWQDLRVALPSAAGLSRFDQRADVTAVGLVALALVLGRPLRAEEYPHRLGGLLGAARERGAFGDDQPLSPPLRAWLARALQLDPRRPFASAVEALAVFEEVVASGAEYVAAPVALEMFLARYAAALLEPAGTPADIVEDVERPAAAVELTSAPSAPLAVHIPPPPPEQDIAAPPPKLFDLAPHKGPHVHAITEVPGAEASAEESTGTPLSEDEQGDATPSPTSLPSADEQRGAPRWKWAAAAAVVVTIAGGGYVAPTLLRRAGTGTLDVQSSPAGIEVVVDGERRGHTPARLTLRAGPHILELRGRGVPRVTPIVISAGAQSSQYVELAETPQTGQLRVQSQPAGARVQVDGVPVGNAPITVHDLFPGTHEVVLQSATGSVTQTVQVPAGGVASMTAPIGAEANGGPVSGWATVKSPVSVEVREGGKLLGTSDADRLMLATGRHELELANSVLGYRASRSVQVAAGKTIEIVVTLPNGIVNLNASPWAEVLIDGQRVGDTPIGNLEVPIGPHEVVFRNPQLGEKRHAISVTLAAPVRLSVDMK